MRPLNAKIGEKDLRFNGGDGCWLCRSGDGARLTADGKRSLNRSERRKAKMGALNDESEVVE